jgi:hypothetical protein
LEHEPHLPLSFSLLSLHSQFAPTTTAAISIPGVPPFCCVLEVIAIADTLLQKVAVVANALVLEVVDGARARNGLATCGGGDATLAPTLALFAGGDEAMVARRRAVLHAAEEHAG